MALAEAVESEESEDVPSPPAAAQAAPPEPAAAAQATSGSVCRSLPLRVEVVDACGRPVSRAEVAVWDLEGNTRISEVVLTSSDGVAKLLAPATQKKIGFRVLKTGFHSQE